MNKSSSINILWKSMLYIIEKAEMACNSILMDLHEKSFSKLLSISFVHVYYCKWSITMGLKGNIIVGGISITRLENDGFPFMKANRLGY